MKKAISLFVLIFALAAFASAQAPAQAPRWDMRALPPAEPVTVSGPLVISEGMPVIRSGDTTYLVIGISRIAGFIDELKEGAYITVVGNALPSRRDSNIMPIRASTVSVSGRSFDLPSPRELARRWSESPHRDNARPFDHRFQQGRPRGRVL